MLPTGGFGGSPLGGLSLGQVGPLSFGSNRAQLNPMVELRQMGQAVLGLQRGLEGVSGALERVTRTALFEDGAVAYSRSGLDLDTLDTTSKLRSVEDVGSVSTSVVDREPEWAGGSTSDVKLNAAYGGGVGDATLIVEVTRGGEVGEDFLFYRVLDEQGNELADLALRPNFQPGDSQRLIFGLRLELGEGTLETGDRFRFNVRSSEDTDLDPDLPMNGTGNSSPGLDPQFRIRAGSFRVNGYEVLVDPSDSVHDVLERITSGVPGVVASYDAHSERVLLERTQPGARPIDLTGDTSRFLNAMKLGDAELDEGVRNELERPMSGVPLFQGVGAGTFEINEIPISINPGQDTLNEVLERITTLVPDVTASYDEDLGRMEIRSEGEELELGEDTSGMFQALGFAEGFYVDQARNGRLQTVVPDRAALRIELEGLAEQLSAVFSLDFQSGTLNARATAAQSNLRQSVEQTLTDLGLQLDGDSLRTDYGLKIDFDRPQGQVVRFDDGLLEKALRENPNALVELLIGRFGDDDSRGLVERFQATTESLAKGLAQSLGGDSLGFDLVA